MPVGGWAAPDSVLDHAVCGQGATSMPGTEVDLPEPVGALSSTRERFPEATAARRSSAISKTGNCTRVGLTGNARGGKRKRTDVSTSQRLPGIAGISRKKRPAPQTEAGRVEGFAVPCAAQARRRRSRPSVASAESVRVVGSGTAMAVKRLVSVTLPPRSESRIEVVAVAPSLGTCIPIGEPVLT